MWVRGICTVVMGKFDATQALALIEKYRIKMMIGVTAIMKFMLEEPDLSRFDLSFLEIRRFTRVAPCRLTSSRKPMSGWASSARICGA